MMDKKSGNNHLQTSCESDKTHILLTVLQQAVSSETEIRNTARTTLNYYSTLLLSLTGGILLLSKSLNGALFELCFLIGGICLIVIPNVAILHYRSDYRRQVETMTIQAKIEDVLGLTNVDQYQTTYWNHEPIVPPLYVEFRKKHPNSSDFVDSFVTGTDMTYIRVYYLMFSLIGVLYIGYAVYRSGLFAHL